MKEGHFNLFPSQTKFSIAVKPSFEMVSWFPLTLNKLLHLFDVVGVPGGCGRGLLTGKLDEVTVGDIHVEGDAFLRARIGFR